MRGKENRPSFTKPAIPGIICQTMKVLINGKLEDGFLDYHRSPSQYRIKVKTWESLEKISGLYFIRPKSLVLVWSYLKEIGPKAVFHKIRSRLGESPRNEKYKATGAGVVVESADSNKFPAGSWIKFSLPAISQAERIVVNEENIAEIEKDHPKSVSISPGEIQEIRRSKTEKVRGKSAVLFGYGNYAKVNIIPNIKKHLSLSAIHEIDPTQIPRNPDKKITWDTNPDFRDEESYDAALIAGYHHTHAPLAVKALNRGMSAVVEKPIVTEEKDLADLLIATGKPEAKIFASFHKRYSPLNKFIRKDLNLADGKPFNYHCVFSDLTKKFRLVNTVKLIRFSKISSNTSRNHQHGYTI